MSYYHIPLSETIAPLILDSYGRALIVETPMGHGPYLVPAAADEEGYE